MAHPSQAPLYETFVANLLVNSMHRQAIEDLISDGMLYTTIDEFVSRTTSMAQGALSDRVASSSID